MDEICQIDKFYDNENALSKEVECILLLFLNLCKLFFLEFKRDVCFLSDSCFVSDDNNGFILLMCNIFEDIDNVLCCFFV